VGWAGRINRVKGDHGPLRESAGIDQALYVDDNVETSLDSDHSPSAVAERLKVKKRSHISDWVLGGIDGAVTTFAIAAGALGASLSAGAVVVLGVANLLADGLSMAASRYAGARTELERRQHATAIEYRHIKLVPEGEREEVRQLLAKKGFAGTDLDRAVAVVTADQDRWVEFMLVEELGFAPEPDEPASAAIATFLGFLVCGLLPLLPFIADEVVDIRGPAFWSAALTALAFSVVGAVKGHLVGTPRVRAALRTLAIGGTAATVAFVVGVLLRDLV